MKIGIYGRREKKVDTDNKYILFEDNGERHLITFRYSHRKGIEPDEVMFDYRPVKVIHAYPPLPEVIQECVITIFADIEFIIGKFVRKMVVDKKFSVASAKVKLEDTEELKRAIQTECNCFRAATPEKNQGQSDSLDLSNINDYLIKDLAKRTSQIADSKSDKC